jgi:predicted nucleotidyltransferase
MRPTATVQTGLPPAVLTQMVDVLCRHPEVQRAVLFGSRAKGNARPNSDIDLALYGDVPPLVVERIADELDELPTPYLFDLQAIEGLQNPALLEHIQRVGIEIYSAAQAPALQ